MSSSWVTWVAPKANDQCPSMTKAEGDLGPSPRGEGHVRMETEIGVMWPRAQEHWGPRSWNWRGSNLRKEFEPAEGARPLVSGFCLQN